MKGVAAAVEVVNTPVAAVVDAAEVIVAIALVKAVVVDVVGIKPEDGVHPVSSII